MTHDVGKSDKDNEAQTAKHTGAAAQGTSYRLLMQRWHDLTGDRVVPQEAKIPQSKVSKAGILELLMLLLSSRPGIHGSTLISRQIVGWKVVARRERDEFMSARFPHRVTLNTREIRQARKFTSCSTGRLPRPLFTASFRQSVGATSPLVALRGIFFF